MKIIADINVLARAVTRDAREQADIAIRTLRQAEGIAIPTACLCELVWVLRRVYSFKANDVAAAIEALINAENVTVERSAVEAGLAILQAGGDFADGVIAHEGRWLGGESFVSFDKKAVEVITAQGHQATLLSS